MLKVFIFDYVVSITLEFTLKTFPGSKCSALGEEPGTCQLLTDCYNPGDFKKFHPPICTFQGKIPVICCADSLGLNEDDFRVNLPTRALECTYVLHGRENSYKII